MKISLQLKATLENVASFRPDGDDFRWYLKVKCMSCGEETEHFQYVSLSESHAIKGSRGEASLVIKCRLCGRENSLDILPTSVAAYTAVDAEKQNFHSVIAFDCRGIEPTDFSPRTGWLVEASETGTKFTDVNLVEKEWADYDENGQQSVGIFDLEFKFGKL